MSNFTCQPIVTTTAFFTNMSTQAQRRSDTRASMCALQLNSVRVGLSVPVHHLIRVYWFMLTDLTEGLQVTVASCPIMHAISLDSYRDQSTKLRSRPALTNWRPWGSIRWVANQIEVSVGQQQSVWTWSGVLSPPSLHAYTHSTMAYMHIHWRQLRTEFRLQTWDCHLQVRVYADPIQKLWIGWRT
jgi:hypothetical protein